MQKLQKGNVCGACHEVGPTLRSDPVRSPSPALHGAPTNQAGAVPCLRRLRPDDRSVWRARRGRGRVPRRMRLWRRPARTVQAACRARRARALGREHRARHRVCGDQRLSKPQRRALRSTLQTSPAVAWPTSRGRRNRCTAPLMVPRRSRRTARFRGVGGV